MVRVHWEDIARDINSWLSWEQALAHRPMECLTVGYMLVRTDKYVSIIQSAGLYTGEDVGAPISIPVSNIINITTLTEDKDGKSISNGGHALSGSTP
jgi:hypothetical protein